MRYIGGGGDADAGQWASVLDVARVGLGEEGIGNSRGGRFRADWGASLVPSLNSASVQAPARTWKLREHPAPMPLNAHGGDTHAHAPATAGERHERVLGETFDWQAMNDALLASPVEPDATKQAQVTVTTNASTVDTEGTNTTKAGAVVPVIAPQVVVAAPQAPAKRPLPKNAYVTKVYGHDGDTWDRTSIRGQRLLDWSYAGYGAGERPIPSVPQACNVKVDYGAVGDGVADDSAAFLRAISETYSGAIYIPPGRYRLSVQLTIVRSGVVLKGAGRGLTTLFFTKSLTDLYGQTWSGEFADGGAHSDWKNAPGEYDSDSAWHSDWANAPGLIRFLGPTPDTWRPLANVIANATRGTRSLKVDNSSAFSKGQWISLSQDAAENDLSLEFDLCNRDKCPYGVCIPSGPGGKQLRWHSRLTDILPDNTLVLERTLPFNVSTRWGPIVHEYMSGISEVGIQGMTLEMKWQAYDGHFKEDGWNGVEFTDTSNCWATDLKILNADTLVSVYRSSFCTVDGVVMGVTQTRGKWAGAKDCHHGLNVSSSQDVLFTNWDMQMICQHDITVFNHTVNVVVANGTGIDVSLDHHRFYPYGVLWSNISLGAATRWFVSGGHTPWGFLAASFNTFWNVTAKSGPLMLGPPGWDMGSKINFIGMPFDPSVKTFSTNNAMWLEWYREDVPSELQLYPGELYGSMLGVRLDARAEAAAAVQAAALKATQAAAAKAVEAAAAKAVEAAAAKAREDATAGLTLSGAMQAARDAMNARG
ncbi:hypothetical protein FOA52_013855 [Chlamydomonas sp. UWO 241]|nr:hypothetical protein FOA52_013855 [Chlamydomonas sp. UWO 241]